MDASYFRANIRTLGSDSLVLIGIELKLLVRQIEGYDVYLSALGDVA